MYTIEQSGKFKKDFKKYLHDKEKLIALNEVIKHLEETGEVPKEFYPHPLKGEYSGAMECHIQSDFLLIWVDKDTNVFPTYFVIVRLLYLHPNLNFLPPS